MPSPVLLQQLLTWIINLLEGGKCQETGKASRSALSFSLPCFHKVDSKGFSFKLEKVNLVISANIPWSRSLTLLLFYLDTWELTARSRETAASLSSLIIFVSDSFSITLYIRRTSPFPSTSCSHYSLQATACPCVSVHSTVT